MKIKQVKNIKPSVLRRTFNDETLIMAFLNKWQAEISEQEIDMAAIPVRLCALIESYVRLKCTEVMNNDKTALERLAKNFNDPIKLSVLAELNKENLSIGSFMAYQVSCSSINSIKDTLKKIIG